jgi:hypothetical protein
MPSTEHRPVRCHRQCVQGLSVPAGGLLPASLPSIGLCRLPPRFRCQTQQKKESRKPRKLRIIRITRTRRSSKPNFSSANETDLTASPRHRAHPPAAIHLARKPPRLTFPRVTMSRSSPVQPRPDPTARFVSFRFETRIHPCGFPPSKLRVS